MSDLVITATTEETCACCGASPPACTCSLKIPPLVDPFVSLAAAIAAIAAFVSNCIGFIQFSSASLTVPTIASFTADDSTPNEVQLNGSINVASDDSPSLFMYASVALAAVSTLTVNWTVTGANRGDVEFFILKCDQSDIVANQIDSNYDLDSGTFVFSDLAAGEYVLAVLVNWNEGNTLDAADFTIDCDGTMIANQAIAAIDSGAGILNDELRACPAMDYISPFSDESAAETWMSSLVANCLAAVNGIALVGISLDSFTANDSTPNTLAISLVQSTPDGTVPVVCSLNLQAGSTLSVGYSFDAMADMYVSILDRHGAFIDGNSDIGVSSGTLMFSIAKTGEYKVVLTTDFTPYGLGSSSSYAISSDDTLTVNPVVARYQNGSSCPTRLPCS